MTTTLLGVDDSKTMRKVLEITFAGEDFRTVLAENADDAMSKLHAERPSVVLVDAALDGSGGGYDLCQRLKAAAPGVGVVLLSSKQQPYDRNRAAQAGADDFIDKPFDTQQLIDKVVGVLRKGTAAAQAPKVPASAPNAAAAPPLAAARPQPVESVSARPRTATLAYGSHFTPAGAGSPVAPVVPPTAAPARPGLAPSAPQASARAVTPPPPAAAPAPAPVAAPIAVAPPAAVAAPAPPPPAPAPVAAVVANHTANGSDLSHKLAGLGLTAEQVAGVLALSRDVVEKVVWEVVPTLAETIIKEEIRRLTSD